MDFITGIRLLKKSSDISKISLIEFYGSSFPTLFFSQVYNNLSNFSYLDINTYKFNQIQTILETSFLGQSIIYILKDISVTDIQVKKQLLEYLSIYRGPHIVIFFNNNRSFQTNLSNTQKNIYSIEVPSLINAELYKELVKLYYPEIASDDMFNNFLQKNSISLDKACLLMQYQAVLGKKCDDFFNLWFSKIITSDTSLFVLSQNLFSKQYKEFFNYWNFCYHLYAQEFWVSFWSEQLWQAFLFVVRSETKGIPEAKKLAFRLPFSFMNKDWRNYNTDFLIEMHNSLYSLDYSTKHGVGYNGLELWYQKFLLS